MDLRSRKELRSAIRGVERERDYLKREFEDLKHMYDNAANACRGQAKRIEELIMDSRSDKETMYKLEGIIKALESKIEDSRRADVVYAAFKALIMMGIEFKNHKSSTPDKYDSMIKTMEAVLSDAMTAGLGVAVFSTGGVRHVDVRSIHAPH